MRRVIPPALERQILPHPGGRGRAKLLHKRALGSYLLFFFVLFFTLTSLDARFPGILGFATDISVADILTLTNEQRAESGLAELTLNDKLSIAAEAKARDMFLDDYWAHVAPDGTESWDFIDNVGYVYLAAGENLAKDFNHSDAVVRAWMDSPSHRENLLSNNFEEIGVAVVDGDLLGFETTLVVQMFGKSQTSYLASVGEGSATEAPGAVGATFEPAEPAAEGLGVETELTAEGHRPLVQTQVRAQAAGAQEIPGLDLSNFALSSGFIFVVFLGFLFLLDVLVVSRRRGIRFTARTAGHLVLLVFLLLGIWYSQVGAIL